jgi:DNA mismatch repair protein MutS2
MEEQKRNPQENTEIRLGFDQIKEKIAAECLGDVGKRLAGQCRLLRHYETLVRHQEQVREFQQWLTEGLPLPESNYFDLEPYVQLLEVEDYVLMGEQWSRLSRGLKTIESVLKGLRKYAAVYPQLNALGTKVEVPVDIFFRLETVFDEDGDIKDSASPELNRLRKQKIDEQSRLRRKLEQALKSAIASGFIGEDAGITFRNGRMVIPVLAEHKRKIRGFVQDESATGQTVFLEPEEALDANNRIREIQFAENRELYRILTELTQTLRPHRKALALANLFLGQLDLVRAKARFGLQIKACMPGHHAQPDFRLFEARHPLLYLAHKKSGKPVVPLTVWLTPEKRVLVISGPNAGGKSICLKTVGLLQYMWQSGIPVPVGEGSRMGMFQQILVDIGDQQSIENDLSTYSSHLYNMNHMLREANADSLILLDEFGTGTDPALGGPIAEAILEALCHKKVYGMVNTHYSNLKNFASRHPMLENAAMKFDGQKMEPLFELEIGQPGSSYALEIAEKIGLPRPVLNQAKSKIGVKKVNVDKLMTDLSEEKRKWESKNQELKDKDKKTRLLLQENEKRYRDLENQKKTILNEAKVKARNLLDEANRKIEETIRTIKESQADKSATREVRLKLEQVKEQLVPETVTPVTPDPEEQKKEETPIVPVEGPISAGDFVRIQGTESIGIFLGRKGKDASIQIGDLKTHIRMERLEKMSGQPKAPARTRNLGTAVNLNEKMMRFENQLDVRGLRAEEALSLVDSWIDEALLLGQKELRIVHGKGDGILRTHIRNLLRKYRQVEQIRDEHADRGGAGVTLFQINQ